MTSTPTEDLAAAFIRCRDMDASLAQRLDAFSTAVRQRIPMYADAVDRLVQRLAGSGAGDKAPKPGDRMPPFVLPDEAGRLVALGGLLQKGPVAVTFHRGHWCPWCRISVNALAQAQHEIARAGAQVVAIMPERQRFTAAFKAEARSPFPVLSDMDNSYAMSLNLAIWVGADLERLLALYGRQLPEYQANDAWLLPIPATFVVRRDGVVSARFLDPDFRRRVAVSDLIDALAAAA
jgi:peroxiredoxin